jgi:fermentation-respiration switch protein FrsA (DUF1100 family)
VHIAHGADDDVIPVEHADALLKACASAASVHQWITGMFGHAGPEGLAGLLGRGPAALREFSRMYGLLMAIVSVSHPAD